MLALIAAVAVIGVLYIILRRVTNPPPQEPDDEPDRW